MRWRLCCNSNTLLRARALAVCAISSSSLAFLANTDQQLLGFMGQSLSGLVEQVAQLNARGVVVLADVHVLTQKRHDTVMEPDRFI